MSGRGDDALPVRTDFETFGGFDESIYAAEDVQLAYDLKKIGKPRGQKFN